jgi:hypothetical protein
MDDGLSDWTPETMDKKNLIVQLFCATDGDCGRFGTAYPVSQNVLLTAGHVVGDATAKDVEALWWHQPDGDRRAIPCTEILWDGRKEEPSFDVLLLRCPFPSAVVNSWGQLVGRRPVDHEKWASEGFPFVGERGTKPVPLQGKTHSMGDRSECFHLSVAAPADKAKRWKGASGAPVFVDEEIIGVIVTVPRHYNANRFEAVPVFKLLENAAFRKAVAYSNIGHLPEAGQLVFAFGQVGVAFPSWTRVDSLSQFMSDPNTKRLGNPLDPHQLLAYLKKNPWVASSVIWTLNVDGTPAYAIAIAGPYGRDVAELLQDFLADQLAGNVERVSIPGVVGERARLATGQELDVVYPDCRGMWSWNSHALAKVAVGNRPASSAETAVKKKFDQKAESIRRFLEYAYIECTNAGRTSRDRAINYCLANLVEITRVFESALRDGMEFERIDARPSTTRLHAYDDWDVMLRFVYSQKRKHHMRRIYCFTVDVSDVIPVTIDSLREWSTSDET